MTSTPLLAGLAAALCAAVVIGWRIAGDDTAVEARENLLRGRDVAMNDRRSRPVLDRVASMLAERAGPLAGAGARRLVGRRLDLAGLSDRGWRFEHFLALRVAVAALGMVVAGVAATVGGGQARWATTGLVVVVIVIGPTAWIERRIGQRTDTLRRELPDAIDQLSVCADAGLGFDAALERVAQLRTGLLAVELRRVAQDMRLGIGRSEALSHLEARTEMEEIREFVGAVDQATVQGLPMASMLRIQATELRDQRRVRAEAQAGAVGVKIVFPLMLCIMPALFVVILGPIFIDVQDAFR